jgi:hypothetical protein
VAVRAVRVAQAVTARRVYPSVPEMSRVVCHASGGRASLRTAAFVTISDSPIVTIDRRVCPVRLVPGPIARTSATATTSASQSPNQEASLLLAKDNPDVRSLDPFPRVREGIAPQTVGRRRWLGPKAGGDMIGHRSADEEQTAPPAFRIPNTKRPAQYTLRMTRKPGTYHLLERFEYVEQDYSPNPERAFIVPVDDSGMETDLASIPFFATWLVPKDGKHTPAAFLHDAMVKDCEDARTVIGPYVDRHEADRIFRGAMQELGVPLIRRTLMWAAVNLATLAKIGSRPRRIQWRLVIGLTVAASLVFNLIWVNQLFDRSLNWAGEVWGPAWLVDQLEGMARWLDEHLGFLPDSRLALAGLAVTVLVALWWSRAGAGVLTAVVVMFFGYPLLVAAWSFLVYWALEKLLELILRLFKNHTAWPRGPVNGPGVLGVKPSITR